MRLLLFWVSLLLWLFAGAGYAIAGERIALVIGNSGYANTPPLPNPGNDAEDVAKALTSAGFKVALKLDATKREFDLALAQFTRDASDAEAALFYFAGHGVQYGGANYVMPVDATLQDIVSLRYEMVSVEDVKLALESSPGVKILVLDSCRDNPLAEKLSRSLSGVNRAVSTIRGLAPAQPTPGMLIVYSTQSGHVALDGYARNSPFAKAFVEELATPGLEVAALFRAVEQKVLAATDGQQSPELSISGVPEYYITEATPDRTAWDKIKTADDVEALIDFLSRFPTSAYSGEARAKLQALQGAQASDPTEAQFWQSTERGDTIVDYSNYLKKYPTGAFASIAINRISAMAAKPGPEGKLQPPAKADAPVKPWPEAKLEPPAKPGPPPTTRNSVTTESRKTAPAPGKNNVVRPPGPIVRLPQGPSTGPKPVAKPQHHPTQIGDQGNRVVSSSAPNITVGNGCAPGTKEVRDPYMGSHGHTICVPN